MAGTFWYRYFILYDWEEKKFRFGVGIGSKRIFIKRGRERGLNLKACILEPVHHVNRRVLAECIKRDVPRQHTSVAPHNHVHGHLPWQLSWFRGRLTNKDYRLLLIINLASTLYTRSHPLSCIANQITGLDQNMSNPVPDWLCMKAREDNR